jgi:hypothetical protein
MKSLAESSVSQTFMRDTHMTKLNALQAGEQIKNWTVFKGYLGDTFRVAAIKSEYVAIETPNAQYIQNVPLRDFETVNRLWDEYMSGRLPRHKIRDLTRFSKYIISILRHVKAKSD